MKIKRVFLFLGLCTFFLVGLTGTSALAGSDDVLAEPTFNLKVSTDYHLNQDGRPTPSYDFLVPLYFDEESVLFFNPRYHVDDRTNIHQAEEWNLGLGYRHMIGDKAILGANVYYDWRRSMTGNQFEQIGAGLELLTENTTARVNGYLTLTGPEEVSRWREYYFAPRSLNYIDYASYEVPQSGIDGEIGFKVPYLSDYCETWVYGGGYYFTDDLTPGRGDIHTEDMAGYKGRVEVKPTEWLSFEFEGRDDNVRGTDLYGQVKVEVPFSIENLVSGKNPFEGLKDKTVEPSYEVALADRMYEKVDRDPDVISGISGDKVLNDGVVQDLIYVWATSPSGTTDGLWATPYKTIASALLDGNYTANPDKYTIFVRTGTYNESPTIALNYTTLWGQGYKPSTITAMPHSLAASYPKITGTLTVNATNVEIMGFSFSNAGNMGIMLSAGDDDAWIHHNEFRTLEYAGILVNGGNRAVIDNNKFYITSDDRSPIESPYGVYVMNSGNGVISNNTFTVTRAGTVAFGPGYGNEHPGIAAIYANSSTTIGTADNPLTIIGNTITVKDTNTNITASGPTVHGINLNVTGSGNDLYALIANNKLTVSTTNPGLGPVYNCNAEGITAFADGTLDVTVTGNDLSGGVTGKNYVYGICLGRRHDSADTSGMVRGLVGYNKLKVVNNDTVDDPTYNNAYGMYVNGTAMDLDVVKNDLSLGVSSKNTAMGFYFYGRGGMARYDVIDNTLKVSSTAGTVYGIRGYSSDPSSSINAVITGNVMSSGVLTTGTGSDDFAYGISLECNGNGTIGGVIDSVIGNNLLKVSSAYGSSYGIHEMTTNSAIPDSLETTVFGNNLSTGGVTGKVDAWGIYVNSITDAYTDIFNNSLKVTGTTNDARGINVLAGSSSYITGTIAYNNMSLGILGKYISRGISLEAMSIGGPGDYLVASGNTLKVTSTLSGDTEGILMFADGDIFTEIFNNNLSTGGINGKYYTYGIALFGGMTGTGEIDCEIYNNSIKVTSTADANGIYVRGSNDAFFADVAGNDLSPGITGLSATGIKLEALNTSMGVYGWGIWGSSVSYNKLKVTATGAYDALGIDVWADEDAFVDIIGNDLSAGISGKNMVYGICVGAGRNIGLYDTGSEFWDSAACIELNKIKATTTYTGTDITSGWAEGILLYAEDGDILADITGNNMSYGVGGKHLAAGIRVSAASGNVGAFYDIYGPSLETGYFCADHNILKVTSSSGLAAGISLFADGDYSFDHESNIYADVLKNDLTPGVTGLTKAYGIIAGLDSWTTSGTDLLSDYVDIRVDDNLLKVSSTYAGTDTGVAGIAAGIWLQSDTEYTYTSVNRNNLSSGITGKWEAYGIYAGTDGWGIIADSSMNRSISYNILKVTSASGDAAGIKFTTPVSSGTVNATITDNTMTAGISGAMDARGISFDCRNIAQTDIGLNSLTVTSTLGSAYGIYANAYEDLISIDIYRNNMLGGVKGKFDAAGIYLYSDDVIGASGAPITITDNQIKVTSTNATFALTPTPTRFYTVSGIHLESNWGDIMAEVQRNELNVTGYGSTIPGTNTTRGVWGISFVSDKGDIGRESGGTYYPVDVSLNNLTVTNSNGAVTTTGAAGVYMRAVGNDYTLTNYGDVWAEIENNFFKVKASKNAYGGYLWAEGDDGFGNIGTTSGTPFTTTFMYNTGTIDGTLTSTSAERLLLYLYANETTLNNVNWGVNYVSPVKGGWTGNYPALAAPFTGTGPVESNFTTGLTP